MNDGSGTPRSQPTDEPQTPKSKLKEPKSPDAPLPTANESDKKVDPEDGNKDSVKNSPSSDGEISNDPPKNSAASIANDASPLPDDDGKTFSIARSGRKAAKRAAERIAEKKSKPKKKGKGKVEEDPWVQCDRCHQWRHLPGSVDLKDLPESWFCELNTFDQKRNNCAAPEQTLKEVAKEKKRAKKLAARQLMEQNQPTPESEVKTEAKKGSKKSSSSLHKSEGSDEETEFDTVFASKKRKAASSNFDDDNVDANRTPTDAKSTASSAAPGKSIKEEDSIELEAMKPKPAKRGRPSNKELLERKAAAKGEKKEEKKAEPKQEWVQCDKCEKWRRLPPRIAPTDLPDVWYCSMNTWDINVATCTAIEDKHEPISKEKEREYNTTSQIPTSGGSSGKLSYRNLIFDKTGRRQKNISERMRAQESLFSSQQQEDACDMSMPPTVMYANSNAFFHKSLNKASSFEDEEVQPSIFDIMAHSSIWKELNNNAANIHAQSSAAYNSIGYAQYCNSDGSLNQQTVEILKEMTMYALGSKALAGHEVLLEAQCRHWENVPKSWLELRSLCTIEIVTFALDDLLKDGLVELICDPRTLSLDTFLYRRKLGPHSLAISPEEAIEQRSSCLKIRKPWK